MSAKNEKALAVQGNNAVAVPDYINESADGKEQIDQNDLSMPRIIVVNALSKQFKDGTAKLGDIVETVGGNILAPAGKSIRGVFLAVRKQRTKFRPKGAGEGIECHSPDGRTALQKGGLSKGTPTDQCAVCEYAQFTKQPDGTIKAPACTEYREFLFLAEGYPIPLILSLGKSAAKSGKKLVEKLNADMGLTNRPIYAFAYELGTRQVIKGGNDWYEVVPKASGFPTKEVFEQAKALYNQYRGALKNQDYKNQANEGDHADLGPDTSAPVV